MHSALHVYLCYSYLANKDLPLGRFNFRYFLWYLVLHVVDEVDEHDDGHYGCNVGEDGPQPVGRAGTLLYVGLCFLDLDVLVDKSAEFLDVGSNAFIDLDPVAHEAERGEVVDVKPRGKKPALVHVDFQKNDVLVLLRKLLDLRAHRSARPAPRCKKVCDNKLVARILKRLVPLPLVCDLGYRRHILKNCFFFISLIIKFDFVSLLVSLLVSERPFHVLQSC